MHIAIAGNKNNIREIVDIMLANMENKPEIIYDNSKIYGDKTRTMNISRAMSLGFKPQVSLEEGIKETMMWYNKNKETVNRRYNIFEQ